MSSQTFCNQGFVMS